MPRFKVRERVRPSGKGRTKSWRRPITGVVERVARGSVFVQWDNIPITDEMEPRELVSLGEFAEESEPVIGEMQASTEALTRLMGSISTSRKQS